MISVGQSQYFLAERKMKFVLLDDIKVKMHKITMGNHKKYKSY